MPCFPGEGFLLNAGKTVSWFVFFFSVSFHNVQFAAATFPDLIELPDPRDLSHSTHQRFFLE